MKKCYLLLLSAFILFAGSCKKDKSDPEAENQINVKVIGKWEYKRSISDIYKNDVLIEKDLELNFDSGQSITFKSDGTGEQNTIDYNSTTYDFVTYKFKYSVANANLTTTEYVNKATNKPLHQDTIHMTVDDSKKDELVLTQWTSTIDIEGNAGKAFVRTYLSRFK